MEPKFGFTLARMLGATTWVALCCIAWPIVSELYVRTALLGGEIWKYASVVVSFIFGYLMVATPFFAVATLRGNLIDEMLKPRYLGFGLVASMVITGWNSIYLMC